MKKAIFSMAFVMMAMSFTAHADILRPQPKKKKPAQVEALYSGFTCNFVTASSKRNLEITGFREDTEKMPAKYQKMMWAGQVASMEKGARKATFVYDLDKFTVGRSGIAGRSVNIEAYGSGQTLKIRFATGTSGEFNGTLVVSKANQKLAEGSVSCKLL